MNIGKRRVAVVGLVMSAVLGAAACGSDNEEVTPPGGGSTTSTISCATGSITASGSSAQKNAIDEWVKKYQQACAGASINYQSVGSAAGRQAFIDGQTAFAGSDSAISGDPAANAAKRCTGGQLVDLPVVAGPVAVIYNLAEVKDLQLSAPALAKIYTGVVTRWNDPVIAADNPGVSLPDKAIVSVHRSDGSGTTDNFTKYLGGVAKADWTHGSGSDWKAPGGQGSKGSDGVTQTVKSTAGAIGYVELSYAENAALSTAKIKNGVGEYVAVSTQAASKGLGTAKIAEGNDLKLTFDYTATTSGAYPIYLVTYEITCTKGLPAGQAALVKSFLAYTSSPDGQTAIADLGYAPLPSELAVRVNSVVATIS
ncbi:MULTISPECIES: phosphate ABC transporter substrate-binding protein PstS [Protofrankia]|uniref:Phosphate-binding protein n=1 Tax=Candidatus Protofrankia datiscae TaxID=2716812 RepID=F8AW47_9ACTN|nr:MULTISPECIES: phosphate ABC transporter substrate-binding protein PstS [Protofrankia]AEH11371.1 phosphate ABC transporter, periplasmic phosphate-binding protein [Candidatus Protofrankia datiscae]